MNLSICLGLLLITKPTFDEYTVAVKSHEMARWRLGARVRQTDKLHIPAHPLLTELALAGAE